MIVPAVLVVDSCVVEVVGLRVLVRDSKAVRLRDSCAVAIVLVVGRAGFCVTIAEVVGLRDLRFISGPVLCVVQSFRQRTGSQYFTG